MPPLLYHLFAIFITSLEFASRITERTEAMKLECPNYVTNKYKFR